MFVRLLSVTVIVGAMLTLVGPMAPQACAGLMNFNNSADNYAGSPVGVTESTSPAIWFENANGPSLSRYLFSDGDGGRLTFASPVEVPSVWVSVADAEGGSRTVTGWLANAEVWTATVDWVAGDWTKQKPVEVTAGIGKTIDSFRMTSSYTRVDDMTVNPVPEPGTMLLLATGLLGVLVYARRKRK